MTPFVSRWCPPVAVMEIDTVGTFQMSRAAHPQLTQAGGAAIVNISATLHYGATFYQVPCHCIYRRYTFLLLFCNQQQALS